MNPPEPLQRPPGLPTPIAHHASLVLFKLAGWIQTEMDRTLEPKGLKTRHYSVLSVLAYKGPWSQLQVGQKLRIDKATMVAVVDDLERLGLVQRRRNPEDRRNYQLQVTALGQDMIAEAEIAVQKLEGVLFEPLNSQDRVQLLTLLSSLFSANE